MKILILGSRGQVGWELQRSMAPLGAVTALSSGSREACGDLARLEDLASTVRSLRPDIILNAAAHTAVDKAEDEPALALRLNAEGPAVLAACAADLGALLVHYSTDYVFDGSGHLPWSESAPTAPLSVYGQTKVEGEKAIAASGCRHLIFRTSWVYAARGKNFAKTILRLAKERENLSIVSDQVGAPTGAELIADVTAHAVRMACADPSKLGLYHLAASGETSWHGFATHVCDVARASGVELLLRKLEAIPSSAYPTPAPRPLNSRLDTSKLRTTFDVTLPEWKSGVDRMLAEILSP